MEKLIGTKIKYSGFDWEVTSFTPMTKYPNISRRCEETGKYPAWFGVSKVLKNGNLSEKQTMCVLFFKNGGFVVM